MHLPVMIRVKGQQSYDGAETEESELMTEGTLQKTADGWHLSYEETELTGMAGTTSAFEIRGEKVILTRRGSVNTRMLFEQGRRSVCRYATPFGELEMEIETEQLRLRMTERGGLLEIRYRIQMAGGVHGRSRVCVQVRGKR